MYKMKGLIIDYYMYRGKLGGEKGDQIPCTWCPFIMAPIFCEDDEGPEPYVGDWACTQACQYFHGIEKKNDNLVIVACSRDEDDDISPYDFDIKIHNKQVMQKLRKYKKNLKKWKSNPKFKKYFETTNKEEQCEN